MQVIKYFDTTVFITGTNSAVIFNIQDDSLSKTWLKMSEQLPVDLWLYDNDMLIKEREQK